MKSQSTSRYTHNRNKQNTVILHYCNSCDAKWQDERQQFRCPRCKYMAPRNMKTLTKVIEAKRVNTDAEGRIICHLA